MLVCPHGSTTHNVGNVAAKVSCAAEDIVDHFTDEEVVAEEEEDRDGDILNLLQQKRIVNQTGTPSLQPDGGVVAITKFAYPGAIKRSMSWMLVGAFVFQLALVYAVNWPDEDIRWYTYETIGTAINTFIGVMSFSAFNGLIEQYVFFSQYGESATLALKVAHMLFWIIALQIVLGVFALATDSGKAEIHRDDKHTLDIRCSAGVVTSITAFAVTEVGVDLQNSQWFSSSPLHALAVVPVGFCFMWAIFMIMHATRDAIIKQDGKVSHGEEIWDEETQEGENDAFAVATSFVVVNAFQFALFGALPHHEELIVHTGEAVLLKDFLVMLVGMFILDSMVIVIVYKVGSLKKLNVRFAVVFIEFLSMCSGWFTLAAAKVGTLYLYPDTDFTKVTVKTKLAIMVTAFAFLYVVVLDKISDDMIRGGEFHGALVKVILSQGLLVGFSWEQAFFEAEAGITKDTFLELVGGLLLCISILPAYRWYILPNIVKASLSVHTS